MALWAFVKALCKYWWALLSSAVLTVIALYGLARGESNRWVLFVSAVAAIIMVLVAAFLAWNEERQHRLLSERAFGWLEIGQRFKELDDGEAVVARWLQDSKTKEYKWDVVAWSAAHSVSVIEMCKQAGRRFLDSETLCSKFPDIARIADDRDRWLLMIRQNLNMGSMSGTVSSIESGEKRESEFGDIANLIGASQALCLRLSNDERS
jgi:hypothetical protein